MSARFSIQRTSIHTCCSSTSSTPLLDHAPTRPRTAVLPSWLMGSFGAAAADLDAGVTVCAGSLLSGWVTVGARDSGTRTAGWLESWLQAERMSCGTDEVVRKPFWWVLRATGLHRPF